MKLSELNPNLTIQIDSRAVSNGDLFFCIVGSSQDGHSFAKTILDSFSSTLVVMQETHPESLRLLHDPKYANRIITSKDPSKDLAIYAERKSQNITKEFKFFGVTGTNGKTTTTFLLEALLQEAGYKVGVIGTTGNRCGKISIESTHTTPNAIDLRKLFSEFKKVGANAIAMEVSSHALSQNRTWSIPFEAAIFTNLTQDHLDYHKTMEEYFAVKAKLFRDYTTNIKVINIADSFGKKTTHLPPPFCKINFNWRQRRQSQC